MNHLKQLYRQKIQPQLVSEFKLANPHQAAKIEKIVVNMGLGRASANRQVLQNGAKDLEAITGQKPLITKARVSISTFKLREGQGIGLKVTLRGDRAYDFLERLIKLALPRTTDFRGVKRTAFDQQANFSLGIKEQLIFPEIDASTTDQARSFQCTIVTNTSDQKQSLRLLELLGMPFEKAK